MPPIKITKIKIIKITSSQNQESVHKALTVNKTLSNISLFVVMTNESLEVFIFSKRKSLI